MTIYRGYTIRKGTAGFHILKDIQECSDKVFRTEEAAMDEIDRWKREQTQSKAS